MDTQQNNKNLVFVGKIISMEAIPGADFIVSATVVCGKGGKWRGVVRKEDFEVGHTCLVYLQDAIVPESSLVQFLRSSNWRVKMRRFKGAPSECVITPWVASDDEIGDDLTEVMGVIKYVKPVPASLEGKCKGNFPSFIPKTDEPNWQRCEEDIASLWAHRYYVTEKADGSSTTAYKWKGEFGVCSRNLELEEGDNGYWKVANKYNLREILPEGYALQWETCGPKIQKNPMGFSEIDGLAFSAYNIEERSYLDGYDFIDFCEKIGFPTVRILTVRDNFDETDIGSLATGNYANGHIREGVVIRSWEHINGKMISFKSINLDYEL